MGLMDEILLFFLWGRPLKLTDNFLGDSEPSPWAVESMEGLLIPNNLSRLPYGDIFSFGGETVSLSFNESGVGVTLAVLTYSISAG